MESPNNRIYFKRDDEHIRQLAILERSNISNRNKELIKWYVNELTNKQDKSPTLVKICIMLRQFCQFLDKDLDIALKSDIKSAIDRINNTNDISLATKSGYRKTIKQFYRQFKKIDKRLMLNTSEYSSLLLDAVIEKDDKDAVKRIKQEVENYKINEKKRNETLELYEYVFDELKSRYKLDEIDPSSIITEQDLILLVTKGCRSPKERAFISLLHETGARIGEFLNLRIKDIEIKANLAEIRLDGKTGKRPVYAHSSIPYYTQYLDSHSNRYDPNSFVWLCEDTRRAGQPLMHIGAMRLLKRVFLRAGLNKKHNCHWFRHSRASLLMPKLTEPLVRKYMGWSKDSSMIATYGHISNEVLKENIEKMRGIKKEEQQDQTVQPLKCPLCSTSNPAHFEYCFKCNRPLRVETVLHDQEKMKNFVTELFNDYIATIQDQKKLKEFKEWQANQKT